MSAVQKYEFLKLNGDCSKLNLAVNVGIRANSTNIVLFESLTTAQFVTNFPSFRGSRCLLMSQEFAIGPRPEPGNPVHTFIHINDIHFNISLHILQSKLNILLHKRKIILVVNSLSTTP